MNKYVLTIKDPNKNNAGPKAKEDVLYFLKDEGFYLYPLALSWILKIGALEQNYVKYMMLKLKYRVCLKN